MTKELEVDSTLSHYRIVEKLGAGGMGEVWLAEDTRLRRKVALKLLPAELTADGERVRRFEQEAQAASALNHPNIITVYDIGESEAGRFIVMELVAGRTLRAVMAEAHSLAGLLTLGAQMAKALSAAHAAGITHRDIKPDNIMVRDDGYVKVLDFGLARLLHSNSTDSSAGTVAQQTMPGMILGTVQYMSPEQARGESAGSPSDIFALGIVLYELVTGQHPFHAETLVGYLHAITFQTPAPPISLKAGLPSSLNNLILRMLEKEASRRPTASEVAQALQAIERGSDTPVTQLVESETRIMASAGSGMTVADDGFWVAVLPFKWRGANEELEALAEGLSEDIVTGLARFSYLKVIARSSTLRFTSTGSDIHAIGRELGARYLIDGSLRQAGAMLRVAAQLVDAKTGAHLWAETYDRQFRAADLFALQDDLVPRIVSMVADQYGALVHSMSEALRGRGVGQYSAHEAVLRLFGYLERMTPEEHAEVRDILEAAAAAAPGHSGCQAALSVIYWQEYANSFNLRPDPLGRAHAAARQAVAVGPTNHLAHCNLATVLFFQKDFPAFRPVAERGLALNTMDTSTTALLGTLIAYSGDWEYGLEVIERAAQLNPHHPGWYHFPAFHYAYRRQDYRGALASALRFNMPGYFFTHAALAAVYGQLGELERAGAALRELQALVPDFGALARAEFGKWSDAEQTEHLLDGLRKAGLAIAEPAQEAVSQPAAPANRAGAPLVVTENTPSAIQSGTSPTQSIAVLPFTNISADEENEYFCDGLAEELLNALAKIDALKVVARTSAFSFKGTNTEAREIGKALNVNTVLEGSVRRAGNRLRITVQLVNAADGYHLWSERYDRELQDIFDVQDEIALSVVDALKVKLLGEKKAAVLKRYTENTEAYELYLQGRFHYNRYTEDGFRKAIESFEKALLLEPEYALAFASLGLTYGTLVFFGFISPATGRLKLESSVARVMAIDSQLAEGHFTRAMLAFYYQWEWAQAEQAFKRALELNPNYAEARVQYGHLLAVFGRTEEATAQGQRAFKLDPLSRVTNMNVGWLLWFLERYDEMEEQGRRMIELEPNFFGGHWLLGAVAGNKNNPEEAMRELQKGVALGGGPMVLALLGLFYGLTGEREKAQQILDQLLELRTERYVAPSHIARVYEGLGEMDRVFEWFERACDEGEGNLVYLKDIGRQNPAISADPRFTALLRRIGLPE